MGKPSSSSTNTPRPNWPGCAKNCGPNAIAANRRDASGYPNPALFGRAGFGYPDASRRLAAIAFGPQFFAQPGQFGLGVFVELLDGLPIDSGSTLVAPDGPEGRLKIALAEHLVPEPKPFGRRLALFEPGQHAIRPDRMFHPPPTVVDVCGLWRRGVPRHCRRSIGFVIGHRLHASTFLRPLAPRALPRFLATTDALTPGRRLFGRSARE